MLQFKEITLESLPEIYPYLLRSQSRTCDFTVGGIYMWIDYFDYRYCIIDDTLFIMGRLENDRRKIAFSLPVGRLPLQESVRLIVEYCEANGLCPSMSAVPVDAVEPLQSLYPMARIEELPAWGDYLYVAESLATLVGHKYNKKRNRVNKFMREYPDNEYHELTVAGVPLVRTFFVEQYCQQSAYCDMAAYENSQVLAVLDNFDTLCRLGFSGGYITVGGKVVAFTLGEVLGDTLYVHVEKALYDYAGSYEAINFLYARSICHRHPYVTYINREDDAGDAGLREAKRSYNPLRILSKYDVYLSE